MIYESLFAILLTFLFLSSQAITRSISQFLTTIVRSRVLAVRLMALFFLPGVIIHELSHALMAYLLFVPVGKMEFLPVIDDDHVKLGSVQVGKTDPIRRMLIGVAPVIIGMTLLFVIL